MATTTAGDVDLNPLLGELDRRGFIFDCTDLVGLSRRLDEGPTRIYVGFDPTADSLHVGSLMPLFASRIVQQHGHVPVLLIGGATGMIGDPSGRSDERQLLDDAQLDHNRAALHAQISSLVPPSDGEMFVVDNRDWVGEMSVIELLRDVGRHFSVNAMLAKDSVRLRRESDAGLSFTEFSYQVLQAFDFWWLRSHMDVEVQVGGSDQWGNITAGTDFMRRMDGSSGFGLVWPLLQKSDGTKFGKSAGGNVWLDAARTSPFDFWQFWFNTDDADVETMLLRFASFAPDETDALMATHREEPSRRLAQRMLANDVTAWVHGADTAASVETTARAVFASSAHLTSVELDAVEQHVVTVRLRAQELVGCPVEDVAMLARLCSSKGEARRLVAGGGLRFFGIPVGAGQVVSSAAAIAGGLLVQKGRRSLGLIRVID